MLGTLDPKCGNERIPGPNVHAHGHSKQTNVNASVGV